MVGAAWGFPGGKETMLEDTWIKGKGSGECICSVPWIKSYMKKQHLGRGRFKCCFFINKSPLRLIIK